MLARALATSVGGTFRRIQCTPDLLPSDITGSSVFNQKDLTFEFVAGAVFSHFVLPDPVKRAPPPPPAAPLGGLGGGGGARAGGPPPPGGPLFRTARHNP